MAILGDMLEKAKKDRQVNLPISTLIDQIYSGYVEVDKEKQKKSFSPSGLFYGSGACFSGDTEFLTDIGYRTLGDACGDSVRVWTGRPAGRKGALRSAGWQPATVECFGEQEIVELTVEKLGRKKIIRTTKDHRWLIRRGKDNRVGRTPIKILETSELVNGDSLEHCGTTDHPRALSIDGVRHGFVFGDGYVDSTDRFGSATATMFGKKDEALLPYFENGGYRIGEVEESDRTVKYRRVRGLPRMYKFAPNIKESTEYLYGFLAGYFAADGNIHDYAKISSSSMDNILMIRNICGVLRIETGAIYSYTRLGINGEMLPMHSISLNPRDLDEKFFIHEHHKAYYRGLIAKKEISRQRWTVISAVPTGIFEPVYCVVQPDTEQFTLSDSILTKNCAARWVISFSKGMYELKASPLQAAGMHQGALAHERIQKAMVLSKAVKEDHIEIEVKHDDPPILGYADFMVELFGEMYLGEIKTTKHANFEYRRNTNIIANYHLAQMLVYMYILGLTKGIILYESKDTNELHGITFEMTPERREWVEYCLDWCRNVWELHQSGVMPARSFRKNSKVCQSCPVEARCYNESMSDVKIERLKLPS